MILKVILGVALVMALFLAGLSVYRRLPDDRSVLSKANSETEVTIVKYDAPDLNGKGNDLKIEAYQIDFAAVRRDFLNEPRAAKGFEDYLARRLQGKTLVRAQLDKNGRATIKLVQGNWWIHATFADGDESLEWRLPIRVVGDKQTVELTRESAYERTRKF